MKRHESFRPLSSEHHHGLVQARHLREASESSSQNRIAAATEFASAWRAEIAAHFDNEERCLLPYITDSAFSDRLLADHAHLRALANEILCAHVPAGDILLETANDLDKHIRWEERELFPMLELELTEDNLKVLGEALLSHPVAKA